MKRQEHEDPAPEAGDDTAAAELRAEDEFTAVLRERNEFKSQWERALADYQNLLHRLPRQVEEGVRRDVEPRLKELVAVLDYLEMALASPATSSDAKAIVFGVDMVKKLLVDTLTNMGVEPIDAGIGKPLDPSVHEAISTRDVPDGPEAPPSGTVLSVEKRGYTFKGRPLRHAQVTVARRATPASDQPN
jgi:molecular chaperone GrpE